MNNLFTKRDTCPSCESARVDKIFECRFIDKPAIDYIKSKIPESDIKDIFFDKYYTLEKCSKCGLIFQKTILNESGMHRFYNEWLPNSGASVRGEFDFAKRHALLTQELFTLLEIMRRPAGDIAILDFGMGSGRYCLVAKSMGFKVTGSDISEEVLRFGAENGINTKRLEGLKDGEFDFINTEQVFEHLGSPRAMLQKLLHLLKPGGIIRISVPDGQGIEKKLPRMDFSVPREHPNYLIPVTPGQHVNTFTHASLVNFGKCFGLHPVEVPFWYDYKVIPAMSGVVLAKTFVRPFYRYFKKHTAIYFRAS